MLLICIPALSAARQPATDQVLDDFESASLATRWTADGPIRAERVRSADRDGFVLHIDADPSSNLSTRSALWKTPLSETDTIAFDLNIRPRAAPTALKLDIRLIATVAGERADRWMRYESSEAGWRRVNLPIAAFQDDEFALANATEVTGVEFRFRSYSSVDIDNLHVVRHAESESNDQCEFVVTAAFGDRPIRQLCVGEPGVNASRLIIATDCAGLDLGALGGEVTAAAARFRADFPGEDRAPGVIPLLIFADRADWVGFWRNVSPPPVVPKDADGLTSMRVATAVCDMADPARVRDVFIHEAAHMMIARRFGLTPRSDWLHEGLATRYQRGDAGRAALAPREIDSVSRLIDGSQTPIAAYSAVERFVSYLARDAASRRQLVAALEAVRVNRTADLRKIAPSVFGKSADTLLRDWRNFERQTDAAPTRP
ncbi:MAG: hypothetical protein KDA32_04920 [Phycisphaerales bacterium]|nr:hypothetical protein [Phycisphaerales bacterium]